MSRSNGHERLVLAWQRQLVTLQSETLPSPVPERYLRLHEQVCGRSPGSDADEYLATCNLTLAVQAA